MIKTATLIAALLGVLAAGSAGANDNEQAKSELPAQVRKNLENFDDLDYNVYSNQKWDELSRSHSDDILVHWPDGRTTKGIKRHIEDLKYQFTFAPDTKITEHPIKIAQGDWTAVKGTMEGTFSKPMKTPDGKIIRPTGKRFKIDMVTLGHWKAGKMDEEFLFWDNQAFMQQIGLAK